jgi:hypothetical protein
MLYNKTIYLLSYFHFDNKKINIATNYKIAPKNVFLSQVNIDLDEYYMGRALHLLNDYRSIQTSSNIRHITFQVSRQGT